MEIKYKKHYEDLIEKYGEEVGIKKYKSFTHSSTLETNIIKYGEEEGKRKFYNKKKPGVTIEGMTNKYGEKEGKNRYDKWLLDIRQDLPGFIRRYGEKIGKEKYDKFKLNCVVKDYIKKNENSKYNNRSFNTKVDFYLEKNGGDITKAKLELSKRQKNSDLKSFIDRYGIEDGEKRYKDLNKRKARTLDNFIRLYGEIDGTERYYNYLKKLKHSHSKEYYINKYGENDGLSHWKEINIKKINYFNNFQSKIGNDFCTKLFNKLKTTIDDRYYFSENEYKFYIHTDDYKIIVPDFLMKNNKIVVEFYGDFWHKNPITYNDEISKLIRIKDEKRINKIKELGYSVFIIWENEYRLNKNKIIEKLNNLIINKINENK